MLYLVAYDISDDRRRDEIAAVLDGYGVRVQYSVFEVDCDAKLLASLVDALEALTTGPIDSVRIYRVCSSCEREALLLGPGARKAGEPISWIV